MPKIRSAVDAIGIRWIGVLAASAVAGLAWLLAREEAHLLGSEVVEPLVLALLAGMLIRFFIAPTAIERGIEFAAKELLEMAIVLLGLTLDLRSVAHAGPVLAAAVLTSVTIAIVGGMTLGRLAGLPPKQAILVAVGNAVCGNSAIAAVAPVIRAKKHEVANAIALTAILGVVVVLGLPLLIPLVGLSHYQYGVVAGLTVYAVPQVLAATFPVSVESGQIGTLVKLMRVLLLGPVVAVFAFLHRNEQGQASPRLSLSRFVPWFIVGFTLCASVRTAGAVSPSLANNAQTTSKLITIIAMAGLGLSVDVQAVRDSGRRVALVVLGLLAALVTLALGIVLVFGIAA